MRVAAKCIHALAMLLLVMAAGLAQATPFTTTVPGTGVTLPDEYPEAGGVAMVLTGVNGNIYYQFSDPDGAFVGYQNRGFPRSFRGNPFTINDPIELDCGYRSCTEYFGGAIARIDVRFSAYDGDTQVGGFDENRISLIMNGYNIGSWSGRTTERTNDDGTQSFGFESGFGNNTFNTGWFSSTNAALLDNILSTNRTTTQVFDQTPNDNYWDFTRGPSLANADLRTIAPGYELEKVRRGGSTTYAAVGQVVTYDYTVANIGSVPIDNITVNDDRIGSVACSPTRLEDVPSGAPAPQTATCTATYTVTQADIDAGTITNIAEANGDPEFGQLGTLTDQVTITGPALNPAMTLSKGASPTSFTAAGQQITYTLTVTNTGNATLRNVVVTDPRLPALSCSRASLLPLSADNTNNTLVCTGTYTVTQADVDNAAAGTPLTNTASARARDPNNAQLTRSSSAQVSGPVSAPAMSVAKTALTGSFDAVGDVLRFEIAVRNEGNVTWPTGAVVSDDTADVSCPSAPVAPGATQTCTATYSVTQADLDAGEVLNTASASVTVSGASASGSDTATVPAVQNAGLTVAKTLASGPDPFASTTDRLTYSYTVENTGNVTLSAIDLSDDKVAVTCPATDLAPGATLTCTSDPYAVTQGDIDAGQVTNVASVTADDPNGDPVPAQSDTLRVDADQAPALSLVKAGSLDGGFASGETISYAYTVTNSGNTTITDPVTITDDRFGGPISCPAGDIAPGAAITCTATYTITAADVTAGFVANAAFASDGTVTSNTDSLSLAQTGEPRLSLTKTADVASYDSISDVITYTYVVTNTGARDFDRSVADITIADDRIASVTCDPTPVVLQAAATGPDTTLTCTGTYAVTQADVDAGEIVNLATANTTLAGQPVSSPQVSETVTNAIVPDFTLDKAAGQATFLAGDTITYTFTVTNLTEQRLASVTVNDPLLGGAVCTVTDVEQGSPQTCTATYDVTQADVDAGQVDNLATADARTPTGDPLRETATATVPLDPSQATPSLAIDKRASTLAYAAVGDRIFYVIDVTNDGFVTVSDAVVSDPALGLTCSLQPIAPGATDSSCAGSRTVTQADIDAGQIVNSATVTADGGAISETDGVTATGPARTPVLTFTKVADGPFAAVGDVVDFTLSVTNDGNVTLTDVTITDAFFDPDLTCAIGTLLPGESDSCLASYTVDQNDVNAGEITNTASASADHPQGTLNETATAVVAGPAESPSLQIVKTASTGQVFGAVGSSVTFGFRVENTGNVTQTGVTVTDAFFDPDLTCVIGNLDPGAVDTSCSATYTITQDDVDAGSLTNVAQVDGVTTEGTPTSASDDLTLSGPDQLPAVSLSKTSPDTSFAAVGDVLTYTYTVTNTGNVTIPSGLSVSDDRTAVDCSAFPPGGLAPSDSFDCTASYVVTQNDLDNGGVTNTAEAALTMAVVPSATWPGGVADVTSAPASVTVPAAQSPALAIAKRIAAGTPATFDAVGEVITFRFTVTNTGNVTTTAPVTVDDPLIGAPFTCFTTLLAPGERASCTGSYTVTQADIDAGAVTNTADAETVFDGATVTSPTPATATATAVQQPAMVATKTFASIDTGTYSTGSVITYDYTVENTGNQTLAGPITIVDNLIGTITCSAGDLAPTDPPVTCQGFYTITSQDVTFGSVTNTASAQSPTVNSPPTSETVPVGADPSIEITKVADVGTFNAVGDEIEYTYTVTNTSPGDGGIRPSIAREIVISDDKFGSEIACYDPAADLVDGEIDPGETVTCSATGVYTVTQADLDAVQAGLTTGFVTNNATGLIKPDAPGQSEISSPPVAVTVPGEANNLLSVAKSVSPVVATAAVGDVLTYTITATNDGNQTLSNVAISDPLIPDLTCLYNGAGSPAVLAPTQEAVCTGTYRVTQADIDGGGPLSNTASATATTPQGVNVSGQGTFDQALAVPAPSVAIVKELRDTEPDAAFSAVGQEVVYIITVTNDGNVTLDATTVTDALLPGESCAIGPLAPGAVDTSCAFTYTVTQADLDRGFIDNAATAESVAASPGNPTVSDTDTLTGDGPARDPELTVTKTALDSGFASTSDTLDYTYTIANTGNVTITDTPDVTDSRIGALSCDPVPPGGLRPGEFYTCTGTDTVDQGDLDLGAVTNTVTATADNPLGGTLTATDEVTVTGTRTPAFTLEKTPSITAGAEEGDVITYSYAVTNTGNVTLSGISLTDTHVSAGGAATLPISGGGVIASLAPGQTATLSASYTVTQDDIDAGNALTNTADATASAPAGAPAPAPQSDSASVAVAPAAPALEVVKTVSAPASPAAGDTVTFTITTENTGNVTLTDISLNDTLRRADGTLITRVTADFTAGDAALSVGEVWTYTLTHQLTQADVDAGGLSNTATALAEAPSGAPVDDVSHPTAGGGSTPTTLAITPGPGIEAVKTVTSGPTTLGSTVVFEIAVTNTGNVTLTGVAVTDDDMRRVGGTTIAPDSGPTFVGADAGSGSGRLLPGETARYRVTRVLTQADIDAGGLTNRATVAGTDPNGTGVSDVSDDGDDGDGNTTNDRTRLEIPAAPALALDKALASGGPTFGTVGQVLAFDFTVTNTGNVTLTDPISVDDPLIGAVTCPAGPLAPGASALCTGDYAVTQADIDAGQVVNTATAASGGTVSPAATETVPARQRPALAMEKTAVSITTGNPPPNDVSTTIDPVYFDDGAVITYAYTVTNTGNTTLTGGFTVTDNLVPGISCPALPGGGLAPGADLTCTGSYTVTVADVDVGSTTNTARASIGGTTSPIDSVTVPTGAAPGLTLTKSLDSVLNSDRSPDSDGLFDAAGDILVYSFEVRNTGNAAFARDVTISDALLDSPVTCFTAGGGTFSPGDTVTCTGEHTVTQAELDAGEVFNEATAETTYTASNLPVSSPPSDVTASAATAPGLALAKTADLGSFASPGEVITYTLTFTNTGNQTLRNITGSDPLLPGLVCSFASLAPGDAADCSGGYSVTQADVDAGEVVNTAAARAIDPTGAAVTDTDSLTIDGPAAAPGLTLTKAASPDPFGAVGSGVTYVLTVTNTGNVTLRDVTVTDALTSPAFTCTIPSLAPAAVDDSCVFAYTVTQDDKDAGEIVNDADVTATDPGGNPVTASASITTDAEPAVPGIEATKTASASGSFPGAVITYTLRLRNTGDVTLDIDGITDTMTRRDFAATPTVLDAPFAYLSGDTDGDDRLDVGETWRYRAEHTITQSDIDAGGVDNTVTARATDPFGAQVTDVSDDGDDFDGNTADDPTSFVILSAPAIEAVKTVTQTGAVAGDEVIFAIAVTNLGNVSLTDIVVTDTLTRADGTVLATDPPELVDPASPSALFAPGATRTYALRHVLTQEDVDAGGLSNTATASGSDLSGNVVSDVSDNGDDGDGNTADDPTLLTIAPAPALEVTKVLDDFADPDEALVAGDTVSYTITVENTGSVTLTDLGLTDTLTNGAGDEVGPVTLAFAEGDSETTLAPGAVNTFAATYVLTQDDIDSGSLSNSVTGTATPPSGDPVTDLSDDGDDGDGNAADDPTVLAIASVSDLTVDKVASFPRQVGASLYEVTFDITVVNAGNITETSLQVTDDLAAFVTPAELVSTTVPQASGWTGTARVNRNYDGVTDTRMLGDGVTLMPGATGTLQIVVRFDTTNGYPAQPNTVSVVSAASPEPVEADAEVARIDPPRFFASKSVTPDEVLRGATVTYTLTMENALPQTESGIFVVDDLPAGIVYTPGTARLNGDDLDDPAMIARRLEWEGLFFAPLEVKVITFEARVVGDVGEYVNRMWVRDGEGRIVSNIATATLSLPPEPVFDCADVIGKVFDDRNLNGRQDGVDDAVDRAAITDQTYVGEKLAPGTAPARDDSEPGLPAVRLATVNGTLITTDAFGRFSVPCAELPAAIGSNFTLKLDERTLPTGYVVVTENPRTIRVTPGTVARLNFGAALSDVIDIDLTAAAFRDNGALPAEAVTAGVDQLIAQVGDKPALLRLTYYRQAEDHDLARLRLDAVEDLIRARWRAKGAAQLRIERSIRRVQ